MVAIRSIRLSSLNHGSFHLQKFSRARISDSHLSLSSTANAVYQRKENSLLSKFKSINNAAIRCAEGVIFECTSTALAEHSNPHTFGQYEYFSLSSDQDSPRNSDVIFRRLRVAGLYEDKCRSLKTDKSPVLDINHLMTVVPRMLSVSRMKPSLDHSMIAFAVDLEVDDAAPRSSGKERGKTTFFIKDIRRNIICELDISDAVSEAESRSIVDFEWSISSIGSTILYLVLNDNLHRPCLVSLIDVGVLSSKMFPSNTDNNLNETSMRIFAPEIADMRVILYEDDMAFNVDVGRSKDDKYVIISSHSKTSSQVAVAPVPLPLPLRPIDPTQCAFTGLTTILPRQIGRKYYVDHCNESFYVATDMPCGSPSSALRLDYRDELSGDLSIIRHLSAHLQEFSALAGSEGSGPTNFKGWERVFPTPIDRANLEHENVSIRDFDIFQSKIVIYGRSGGYPTVKILDLHSLPESGSGSGSGDRVVDLTSAIRVAVGSDMFSLKADVGTALDSHAAHFTVSSPLVPGRAANPFRTPALPLSCAPIGTHRHMYTVLNHLPYGGCS